MRIGTARVCLTPKKEFYLIGYRSENRYEPATAIHDDIYGNALLFEDYGKDLFILSADFLEFEEGMAEDVKTLLHDRFGIDRDAVLLSATHNHSSIVSYHKGWYTGKFDQEYYDRLLDTIVSCYQTCRNNAREATARYGRKIITGYYGNRNHPGELADNEVIVVKFYEKNHQPFAGFINWAVHSTVISAENTELTSELAGEVSKKLYASFGFYPAVLVGAAGDCSNRNERQGTDFNELERVSDALAKEIASITVDQALTLENIRIQTLFHTIHHDMKFVHEELKAEIAKMEKVCEEEVDEKKKQGLKKRIANVAKELDIHQFHLDAKCSLIDLGELQFFVFPGELGSAFGKQLKNSYPHLGIIAGYTNGYYEYFMPKEEYGLSFETIGCKVPKGEAEVLIDKLMQASACIRKIDKR